MASPSEHARRLAAEGRVDEAAECLTRAAQAGEGDALVTLATWRVQGNLIRRDLAEARSLMARAAAAGRKDAALLHAYFLANATGGDSEWGRARDLLSSLASDFPHLREQLDQVAALSVDEHGDPLSLPPLTRLSEAPPIWSAKDFASAAECAYLIGQAELQLRPATVVDRASGRTLAHPDRKCQTMMFGVSTEDLVISAIRRRIAALAGVHVSQTETLQVIRYHQGDEFRPHRDSVGPGENQRIMTALVYLTEAYTGGETRFLRTGLTFRGGLGDALLFRNSGADDLSDPLAEHAGLPVLSGTKIILSCWIRARPYAFPPPQPASRRY
jgi:prolyl 4-hydroxylase